MAQRDRCAQVDGHQLAHVVGVLPRDRTMEADPGVVDEQIDLRDPALTQEMLDCDGASQIGQIDLAVGLIREELRVERLAWLTTEQYQSGAACGIDARERQSEPSCCPADDNSMPLVAHDRLRRAGSTLCRVSLCRIDGHAR